MKLIKLILCLFIAVGTQAQDAQNPPEETSAQRIRKILDSIAPSVQALSEITAEMQAEIDAYSPPRWAASVTAGPVASYGGLVAGSGGRAFGRVPGYGWHAPHEIYLEGAQIGYRSVGMVGYRWRAEKAHDALGLRIGGSIGYGFKAFAWKTDLGMSCICLGDSSTLRLVFGVTFGAVNRIGFAGPFIGIAAER